jgi:O-antigen biosynthesis protein WbqV
MLKMGQGKIMNSFFSKNKVKKIKIILFGGAGSIGKLLCGWLAKEHRVLVADINETELYMMEKKFNVETKILNIASREDVNLTFVEFKPDLVINLAAYKHVFNGEKNTYAVLSSNITGSLNITDACVKYNVHQIYVGTDKSVNPMGIYGASKLIAERYVLEKKGTTIRFGNVVKTRGAIYDLLTNQKVKQITLYHRGMTRFYVSANDVIELFSKVISDLDKFKGMLVTKKFPSFKIVDIIELYNVKYDVVDLLRKGEKVHEELLTEEEMFNEITEEGNLVYINYKKRAQNKNPKKIISCDYLIGKDELKKRLDEDLFLTNTFCE